MPRLTLFKPIAFLLAAMAAAAAPLVAGTAPSDVAADAFPGWPTVIEGRVVEPLPLSPREAAFARDFPGRLGRFCDGEREIILRWVATPTRRLHPAGDCFRGLGYKVTPVAMRTGANGGPMSCFRALGARDAFEVCEQITSTAGDTWPDVSSWYWHALWSRRGESWWSLVVARPIRREH